MPLSKCQKITVGVILVVVIICIQLVVLSLCSFQTKARVIRANFILVIQTIMFMFSILLWRTFAHFVFAEYIFSSVESFITRNTLQRIRGRHIRKARNSESDLSSTTSSSRDQTDFTSSRSLNTLTLWKIVLLLYLIMCHTSYITNLYFIGKDPYWIGLITYACLGSFIQLNTGLLIFKFLSVFLNIFPFYKLKRFSPGQLSSNTVVIFSLLYMICASLFGLYNASQLPTIKAVTIPIKDLPSNLEGLKIIQLSDIHLGPTVGFTKLNRIVFAVNGENPDVVVLTGDLVDGSVEHLKEASEPLRSIKSKYGNFFVTGNHEYYTGDVDNWFSALTSLGFTVLHNSHTLIPSKSSDAQDHICLAGTDDIQANHIGYGDHKFDLDKAVGNCSKLRPVILLAHQPRAAKIAVDSPFRIDLVLSGHTHGGQMFPMMIGAYLLNPFFAGLYKYGPSGSYVYVSQGTQYWGIPMRIATTMEITRITLHSTKS